MASVFLIVAHWEKQGQVVWQVSKASVWAAPPRGLLKLNIDAAVVDSSDFFAVGAGLIRDANGVVWGAFSTFLAECFALRD